MVTILSERIRHVPPSTSKSNCDPAVGIFGDRLYWIGGGSDRDSHVDSADSGSAHADVHRYVHASAADLNTYCDCHTETTYQHPYGEANRNANGHADCDFEA
jgi:hypothetical protein